MKKKIAYILSRFPTVSETFILYEMIELGRLGVDIEIFPLIHQRGSVIHPEVKTLLSRVHYASYFSPDTLRDHWFWMRKKPKTYMETVLRVLAKNFWSPKFLSRAVAVIIMSAHTARKIEQLEVDLVHAHSATHPTLVAYIVSRLTGIPYSFTAHSSDIYFNQTMLSEKIQHARFIATISEYNRAFLRSIHPSISMDKIKVIHCGIDPTKFQPNHLGRSSKSFTIICVGRLEKIKGQEYLIETCAQLKSQNIDFCCYLVGDGELQSQIQRQINKLNLDGFVQILGFQPHHKVAGLLKQADILVLPSISEGIPVAVMEAMASGIPVVATSVTGVPELVEDCVTGFLVPSRNSSALTDAILRLYKSPELRRQMGESGRKKVIRDFSLRRSAVLLHNSFQEV